MSLTPFTIEEMRQLHGAEKAIAMARYRNWLQQERDNDKRLEHNKTVRLYHFINQYTKKGKCFLCGAPCSTGCRRCKKCYEVRKND